MQLRLPGIIHPNPKVKPSAEAARLEAATPEKVAQLSVSLETALIRELRQAYRELNISHFQTALRPPTLELSNATSFLGRWCSKTRTLEISRSLAIQQPWNVVLEVLKHEMAHQYVEETLGDTGAGHGPQFRRTCSRLGINPKASGLPNAGDSSDDQERVLTRVSGLLALAESPNHNEAQAAMSAAQRLMLRYNIDQAQAKSETRRFAFRQVGRITGRISESERLLAGLLGEHFFVEAIWVPAYQPELGKTGSVLEICGTNANLEMASYVHAFLSHTAQRLWENHKLKSQIRSNRDRQTYLAGVILGFHERLVKEREIQRGQGLVWVGDAQLNTYLRQRHPHIRRVRHQGNPRTAAREQGKEAGRNIVLRKPISAGANAAGKVLPPGR